MVSVSIFIAHAEWAGVEREKSLARMLEPDQAPSATISRSLVREHASVWARRMWGLALEDRVASRVLFLNDDVVVAPDLEDRCEILAHNDGERIVCFHTTSPAARSLWESGEHFLRSYWVTGPSYMFPVDMLREFVSWWDAKPQWFKEGMNEDNHIMHWLWERQTPAWHTLPALVKHDTSVPSTLGYDHHSLRTATVTWENTKRSSDWKPGSGSTPPPLVDCPWMSTKQFCQMQGRLMGHAEGYCQMCLKRPGRVQSSGTGCSICENCALMAFEAMKGQT